MSVAVGAAAGAARVATVGTALSIIGYVLAAVLLFAITVGLVLFGLRRRATRAAAVNDHPASFAPLDEPAPVRPINDTNGPTEAATRFRRREAIPPIRVAEPGDQERLAEIEAQSDPGLTGAGLGALPNAGLREGDPPAAVRLVAGRPPVAYIRVDEVDGMAHIDQLGVLPSVARRGIGKALVDAAIEWARQEGYPAVTLSTFAESEWNVRVYDPTGFILLDQLTPGLRELRDWERAIGLDSIGTRVVMRRELHA